MLIRPALDVELPAVSDLVNSAYRGDTSRAGWTTEADYLGGQRTDAETLRTDLAASPDAMILTLRDDAEGPILGVVWVEPAENALWYVGMVTVNPTLQDRKLGRTLLEAAEVHAVARGAQRIEMTVVNIRDSLIAWYERRGYLRTGETRPFPYDDELFGVPLRDDLTFVVLEKSL